MWELCCYDSMSVVMTISSHHIISHWMFTDFHIKYSYSKTTTMMNTVQYSIHLYVRTCNVHKTCLLVMLMC